eukprot:CAMPEP_0177657674 /NCGR_PEP_ID=MMETSP0447-20121125/16333_1 /TAXON_ID=0 /ORGANISM="Stygamoeba regulata, Strain BSH-02190019" /LENGTH=145 /DNA_ID=CAMNT_0019162089 /DNA_START=75 /DNA_END=512 /DNA_ORIENTATION=+
MADIAQEIFQYYDQNKDGKVCANDLVAVAGLVNFDMSPLLAKTIIDEIGGGKGFLSLEDMKKLSEAPPTSVHDDAEVKKNLLAFCPQKETNDGRLNLKDLLLHLKKIGKSFFGDEESEHFSQVVQEKAGGVTVKASSLSIILTKT